MPYTIQRVFCAAGADMEPEREAFLDVVGEVNEAEGIPRGILYAPIVPLQTIQDKRLIQYAIDDNIRSSRYYVLVIGTSWGLPEMNFEQDYALAMECRGRADQPMKEVVVLTRQDEAATLVEPALAHFREMLKTGEGPPHYAFSGLEEYRQHWRRMLTGWLESMASEAAQS